MNNFDKTRPSTPRAKLEQAISLAKSGRKANACQLLRSLVALQPVNQAAWLWLSAITAEQAEAEAALARAKDIDPAHPSLPRAEQWLAHRFPPKKSVAVNKSSATTTGPRPSRKVFGVFNSLAFGMVVVALLVGLAVLILGLIFEVNAAAQPGAEGQYTPQREAVLISDLMDFDDETLAQLDVARAEQDWTTAIAILEKLYQLQPDSQPIKERLSQAYLQKGITLRRRGFVEEALNNFEQALGLSPDQTQAQQELRLARTFLAGAQQYQAGRWESAIEALETVWGQDSNYTNVRDLLYSAYYNHGLARQAAGDLPEAKDALEAAIALRPDLSAPHRLVAEIEFAMAPETPLETPLTSTSVEDQMIVVGITEQRMAVYDGDEQVFDFIVSTGEPGRDTAIGEFEIQNKIDVAYASTWNLDMPYWLGIYWAGPLQNGIHSLPIVKHTGDKLWDGYLGQRVSYGCVILGDADAAALYDWVQVGAKVKIVPSLANWSPED